MNQPRRIYQRIAFSAEVTVVGPDGRAVPGHSINLSRGGIGFYSATFYPLGARVRVEVRHAIVGGVVSLVGTVRWAQADETGTAHGVEFDLPLSPAAQPRLCAFLDAKEG
jgi:hypothetical protein